MLEEDRYEDGANDIQRRWDDSVNKQVIFTCRTEEGRMPPSLLPNLMSSQFLRVASEKRVTEVIQYDSGFKSRFDDTSKQSRFAGLQTTIQPRSLGRLIRGKNVRHGA